MNLAVTDHRLAKPATRSAELRDYDAVRRAIAIIEAHARTEIPTMMPIPDSGNAGAPDFWLLVKSRLVLVETKADPAEGGKDATELQKRFMERWSNAGAITFVVRDEASFQQWLSWVANYLRLPVVPDVPWRSAQVQARRKAPAIPRAASSTTDPAGGTTTATPNT